MNLTEFELILKNKYRKDVKEINFEIHLKSIN